MTDKSQEEMPPLASCRRCPRLAAHLDEVREKHATYHAAPVAAWGRRNARLLIVGLAPGMHGANRTGRPFVGDSSGHFLFAALHRFGFADQPRADNARLLDVRITNAVKCLPPGNRPLGDELIRCRPYLAEELATVLGQRPRNARAVLTLGGLAHRAVMQCLEEPVHPFQHDGITALAGNRYVVSSYHPSRLNTQTGRLTAAMFDRVLQRVHAVLNPGP